MKFALVATLLWLLAAAAPAHAADARIVDEKRIAPRVVELTIATPAFSKPTKVHVDLPTGYDADPAKRWPTTYVLAGTMNTYKTFNSFVDGVELSKDYPSIIVSPNGDSGYWSDWYNDGRGGAPMYETYVVEQLIPLIDEHFRTIAERSQRVLFGISMGGYGAMMIAARHPDRFAAVASLSGSVDSNLAPNAAALSASSTFDGGAPDAIYGPRASQEVRWRGHNPADLTDNLRDLDLQVRSANGVPNPGGGENPTSADTVSCAVELGVYGASISLHETLNQAGIGHLYKDYGPGCHTVANFKREITDTLAAFIPILARRPAPPTTFRHRSIEPDFDVYDWRIQADPKRALEFQQLSGVSDAGLTLAGSGVTTVTTPPLFKGLERVDLEGARTPLATPDADGRIRFSVDLGPPNTTQQYTPGASNPQTTRSVTFRPHAAIVVTRIRAGSRAVRVCARAAGGTLLARLRLRGTRPASLALTGRERCRELRRTRRVRRATLVVAGQDALGHAVESRRVVRLPALRR